MNEVLEDLNEKGFEVELIDVSRLRMTYDIVLDEAAELHSMVQGNTTQANHSVNESGLSALAVEKSIDAHAGAVTASDDREATR